MFMTLSGARSVFRTWVIWLRFEPDFPSSASAGLRASRARAISTKNCLMSLSSTLGWWTRGRGRFSRALRARAERDWPCASASLQRAAFWAGVKRRLRCTVARRLSLPLRFFIKNSPPCAPPQSGRCRADTARDVFWRHGPQRRIQSAQGFRLRSASARQGAGAPGRHALRFVVHGRESPGAGPDGGRLVDGGPGGERSLPRSGGPWRARRLSWSKPLATQRSGGRRVKRLPVGSPEGEARLVRSTERRSWSGGCNGGRSCPLAKMREPPGERSRGLPAHILRAVSRRPFLLGCAFVLQRAGSGTKPQ